ncbi:MAG: formylglycine-generating enzyme family protein [gamma proteobacterium symbiont of Phacoides pectinatus]
MVLVPGGEFTMASDRSMLAGEERPAHRVAVGSFAIGRHEVTFTDYARFATATGRPIPGDQGWGRGDRPVINVSWHDAQAYVEWLSRVTGKRYRLPTEAEWEYAAQPVPRASIGGDTSWLGTGPTASIAAATGMADKAPRSAVSRPIRSVCTIPRAM